MIKTAFRLPPGAILERLVVLQSKKRIPPELTRDVLARYRSHPAVWEAILRAVEMPPVARRSNR